MAEPIWEGFLHRGFPRERSQVLTAPLEGDLSASTTAKSAWAPACGFRGKNVHPLCWFRVE